MGAGSDEAMRRRVTVCGEAVAGTSGQGRFRNALNWLRSANAAAHKGSYRNPSTEDASAAARRGALIREAALAVRNAAERVDAVLPQPLRDLGDARWRFRAALDAAATPLDQLTQANAWVLWSSRQLDKPRNRVALEAIDLPAAIRARDQVMDETGLRLAAWAEAIDTGNYPEGAI